MITVCWLILRNADLEYFHINIRRRHDSVNNGFANCVCFNKLQHIMEITNTSRNYHGTIYPWNKERPKGWLEKITLFKNFQSIPTLSWEMVAQT